WIVEPDMKGRTRLTTILHLDTLLRGAHLTPVFGAAHIPVGFCYTYTHSIDAFKAFFSCKQIYRRIMRMR
ncbi:hypothetical protein FB45DRAFT_763025, partial [Roridomyces roridus]